MMMDTTGEGEVIFVNFKEWRVPPGELTQPLSHFIREKVRAKGTKIGCGEGGCGSCTVLVSRLNPNGVITHWAVNSCIVPVGHLVNTHVLTVEGVSDDNKSCHVIQESIAANHGTQCGFCTPGMVMSMYGQLANKKDFNITQIKKTLEGNLCRCTGYRPILDAFLKCSASCSGSCSSDIEDTCSKSQVVKLESIRQTKNDHEARIGRIEQILLKASPLAEKSTNDPLASTPTSAKWFRPSSVTEALDFLHEHPEAHVVGGMTELWKLAGEGHGNNTFVSMENIPEMKQVQRFEGVEGVDDYLQLGAGLTITEMVQVIKRDITELPHWKTRGLRAIVDLMTKFGSEQIRNMAEIGGSIMSANEASDLKVFYEVMNCWAYRHHVENKAIMSRRTPIPGSQRCLVTHLEIPYTKQNEYVWMGKVAKRKTADYAILSLAGKVTLSESHFVQTLLIGFGGSAVDRFQVDFHLEPESTKLSDDMFFGEVYQSVVNEMEGKVRSGDGIVSLLKKFFNHVNSELSDSQGQSGSGTAPADSFKSSQIFAMSREPDGPYDLVGAPIVHASAYKHASGEARYCDDTPRLDDELFLAFVLSDRAHAKILNIDPTEALKIPGVVGYVTHADAVKNSFAVIVEDEQVFATDKVTCYGQIIGGIVATDRLTAHKAAKLVSVTYEDIQPLILTIEDAISHSSFYEGQGMNLKRQTPPIKDEDKPCATDRVLRGEMRVGSQAHFYLEPQGCIVIPKGEDDEMEIISATQNPNDVQRKCAEALGIPSNRVVVKVKRIGGGFGGKETRCLLVALPTAIAAKKFNRPVRCILDRETDMKVSGKRHTFLARYQATFSPSGRVKSLKMTVFCDGGNTLDISPAAIERALVNMDNAYNIPDFDLEGIVCKTNLASNTAFRGTGGPQAALIIEGIMDRIAASLSLDPVQVRQANFYKENDITPYGQTLTNCTVSRCWEECLKISDYQNRLTQIQAFNRQNSDKKRGISVNPAHFGIAYTVVFLNQGAALVNIYIDGSVLVTHGGVEIGQGLHTKLIQIASRVLKVDVSKIRISDTATDKVPNPTPSSASSGTDLIGPAVIQACQTLLDRLIPYLAKTSSWEEAVSMAYMDRVSLSATGFHKVPRIGWNEDRVGSPFNYFSTGAACTEVEVDCLTGEHTIIRTDIMMDVGESLNPAIDIGQIEGAFLQGTGFFTTEELVVDGQGKLLTVGPSSYKVPNVSSVPQIFNVGILKGSSNPYSVYSSKTVGEPPLLLATSVFYAIKDALRNYRKANCMPLDFQLDSPATIERIVLAATKAI